MYHTLFFYPEYQSVFFLRLLQGTQLQGLCVSIKRVQLIVEFILYLPNDMTPAFLFVQTEIGQCHFNKK